MCCYNICNTVGVVSDFSNWPAGDVHHNCFDPNGHNNYGQSRNE